MADLSKTVKSMTRNELYRYYLINEYDDCMPFSEYVDYCRKNGVVIKESDEK